MALCDVCPLPTAITDIGKLDCPEDLGQILRIVFQRRVAGSTFVLLSNAATALASWTAFEAAADDTKLQVTPIFDSFVVPVPEPVTEGGNDNTTPFGDQIITGVGFIAVTGRFRSVPNSVIKELKTLRCEQQLGVYLVNEFGKIWAKESTTTPGTYTPIPISNFFVSDAGSEGKNTNDFAPFGFNLREGWRDDISAITPADFDPLDTATFFA